MLEREPSYREPQPVRRAAARPARPVRPISAGLPRAEERFQRAVLWVLNLADGEHSLLDVAERAELPFAVVVDAADALVEAGSACRRCAMRVLVTGHHGYIGSVLGAAAPSTAGTT